MSGHIIKLTYFKPSGKYYHDDTYTSELEWFYQIYDEVKAMKANNTLPGITSNGYTIHIDSDTHPNTVPALIL